jgi:hypothetical protein
LARFLAEEISRGESFEQTRLVVIDDFGDFDFTFQDQVKRIFDGIFTAEYCTGGIVHQLAVVDEFRYFAGGNPGKSMRDDFTGSATSGLGFIV